MNFKRTFKTKREKDGNTTLTITGKQEGKAIGKKYAHTTTNIFTFTQQELVELIDALEGL